jgi:hypothetical protein
MYSLAGFEKKKYEFKEANLDELYEQVILESDWESTGGNFFTCSLSPKLVRILSFF